MICACTILWREHKSQKGKCTLVLDTWRIQRLNLLPSFHFFLSWRHAWIKCKENWFYSSFAAHYDSTNSFRIFRKMSELPKCILMRMGRSGMWFIIPSSVMVLFSNKCAFVFWFFLFGLRMKRNDYPMHSFYIWIISLFSLEKKEEMKSKRSAKWTSCNFSVYLVKMGISKQRDMSLKQSNMDRWSSLIFWLESPIYCVFDSLSSRLKSGLPLDAWLVSMRVENLKLNSHKFTFKVLNQSNPPLSLCFTFIFLIFQPIPT